MGAIVLTRARIGARSTVAAGSVVLEDFEVPDDMLAAGNPATLKKQLDGRTASAFQNPSAPSEIANGLDIRPSIAVTRARLDVPEIRVAPSAGAPREILYDRMKTAVIRTGMGS
jgi:hypothetical protein